MFDTRFKVISYCVSLSVFKLLKGILRMRVLCVSLATRLPWRIVKIAIPAGTGTEGYKIPGFSSRGNFNSSRKQTHVHKKTCMHNGSLLLGVTQ